MTSIKCLLKHHIIIIIAAFQIDKDDFSSFIREILKKGNNTILKLGSNIPQDTVIQVNLFIVIILLN